MKRTSKRSSNVQDETWRDDKKRKIIDLTIKPGERVIGTDVAYDLMKSRAKDNPIGKAVGRDAMEDAFKRDKAPLRKTKRNPFQKASGK